MAENRIPRAGRLEAARINNHVPAILREAAAVALTALLAINIAGWNNLKKATAPHIGRVGAPVLKIVFGSGITHPLKAGWQIDEIGINPSDSGFSINISSGGGGATSLILLHKSAPPGADIPLGETLSFRAFAPAGANMEALDAARALLARIRHNDKHYFFNSPGVSKRESRAGFLIKHALFHSPGGLWLGKTLFNPYAALAAALAFMIIIIQQTRCRIGAATLALAFIVTAAGGAARLCCSPRAPVHCNSHGIREIRAYLSPGENARGAELYGHIYPDTMRLALAPFEKNEQNIFRANIIIGSAAVLAFFFLALAVFRETTPALLAGAFMAFSPSQVWMSGTESQMPLFCLAAFSGLTLTILSFRKNSAALFWPGAAALMFAAMLRVETLTILPAAAVITLFLSRRLLWRPRAALLTRAAIAAAIAIPAAAAYIKTISIIVPGATQRPAAPAMTIKFFLSKLNILTDPTLTPVIVTLLAAAAGFHLLKRNKPAALAAAAVFLIIVPITFTVADCRTTALRYQSPAHWIYYISAAWLFSSSCDAFPAKRKRIAIATTLILLAANAAPALALLRNGDEEINEYRILRRATKSISPGSDIYLPVTGPAAGKIIPDFPDYMNSLHSIKGAPPPGTRSLVYIGLDCYRYRDPDELVKHFTPERMRRQCASVCGGSPERTLFKETLDARLPAAGFQKRFFDISVPNPRVSIIQCGP